MEYCANLLLLVPVLKTFTEEEFIAQAGKLFHIFTILSVKKCFLVSHLVLFRTHFILLPLVRLYSHSAE